MVTRWTYSALFKPLQSGCLILVSTRGLQEALLQRAIQMNRIHRTLLDQLAILDNADIEHLRPTFRPAPGRTGYKLSCVVDD